MRVGLGAPQQFARLLFHLFFFLGDVGDDVAENVERGHAGIARAADRLHGHDHHLLQAEALFQRRQRHHQADGGAIRIGNDKAAAFLPPALRVHQLDVLSVDFRHYQRDIFLHAQRAGISNHRAAVGGEARFQVARNFGVQRGKNHARRSLGHGRRDLHLRHARRNRCAQPPAHGFFVGQSRGPVRGGQPCRLEPGVVLQQLQKPLSDHSGGAQNSNRDFRWHGSQPSSGHLGPGTAHTSAQVPERIFRILHELSWRLVSAMRWYAPLFRGRRTTCPSYAKTASPRSG